MAYERQSRRATSGIVDPAYPTERVAYEDRAIIRPAKTSAAAVFGLVFGLSALFSVLTVLLGPLGIVLSVIGLVVSIFGIRNSRLPGVTGRGTAIGGLVLSIIALLLGAAMALGLTFFLNNEQALNRVEQQVQQWRTSLPTNVDVPRY